MYDRSTGQYFRGSINLHFFKGDLIMKKRLLALFLAATMLLSLLPMAVFADPVDEGYGIILGNGTTIKGEQNKDQTAFLEYVIVADLTAGTTFQLYDFGNKAPWTEANMDEASTPNVIINASNVYEVLADGHYTIYLKMYGPENNQVYIGYTEPTSIREATIKAAVKKMVVDGIFYIVKDNKAYTVFGF